MSQEGALSQRIARRLRRLGLEGFAVLLLEGAGPLTFLAAQVSYMADPFLNLFGLPLAEMGRSLEDPDQLKDLLNRLKEPEKSE